MAVERVPPWGFAAWVLHGPDLPLSGGPLLLQPLRNVSMGMSLRLHALHVATTWGDPLVLRSCLDTPQALPGGPPRRRRRIPLVDEDESAPLTAALTAEVRARMKRG